MRRLSTLAVLILAGTQAHGGAWPRGEGNGFVSLKYSGRWQREAVAVLDFTREDSVQAYGEWGVGPRFTLGAEYTRGGPEVAPVTETRGFVRYTFLQRGPHVASAELGFGRRSNEFEYEAAYLRPGLAWGRGFESRFGPGWMELDAQAEFYDAGDAPALKLDSTIGLNLGDRLSAILQARAADYPGIDPYLRLAPSAVVRLTPWLRVQAEIEAGVYNDDGMAGVVALWVDF